MKNDKMSTTVQQKSLLGLKLFIHSRTTA